MDEYEVNEIFNEFENDVQDLGHSLCECISKMNDLANEYVCEKLPTLSKEDITDCLNSLKTNEEYDSFLLYVIEIGYEV